ncbi:MAG: MerR family transcriptional regulator [Thermodesulfobacteriota bacterium]|nr:MerR family transcriptional regulator [Thermodesulfobacteriota bacterium]
MAGNDPQNNKRLLKIEELSEATGVGPETIRWYIEQELLPEPKSVQGDMVFYDESCVALINLIETFQNKHLLPCKIIKQTLDNIGWEIDAEKTNELAEKLNKARRLQWFEAFDENERQNGHRTLTRDELLEVADLSEEELVMAIGQNLLAPDENGLFTDNDLEIAILITEFIRTTGNFEKRFFSELLQMRSKMIESLVEEEFNVFLKNILNNNISVEDANELATKSLDILIHLIPLSYKQLLNKKMNRMLSEE